MSKVLCKVKVADRQTDQTDTPKICARSFDLDALKYFFSKKANT